MKLFYCIVIILVLSIASESKSQKKRKCNATDVPLSKRCRRQLKELEEEATAADFRQVIHRRHGRKHGKRGHKKQDREDKLWLPVEMGSKIDYEEIFKSEQNLFFEVDEIPTIPPPDTDPAFITVESNQQVNELFGNPKKRNTDSFMDKKYIKTYDLVGNFGYHSPRADVELKGRAILIKDPGLKTHHGCDNAIANKEDIPKDGVPWIAVLERGRCDFFYKIRLAKLHNASAVIIFNHMNVDELPIINTVGTYIPSVIIHRKDGLDLKKLIDGGKKVFLSIRRTPKNITEIDEKVTTKSPSTTTTNSSKNITFANSIVILCLFITRTLLAW